ncbi:BTAD domain-containing putative transcriptional regulator [Streptomyces sp. NRRL B-1347]|uniref:BTAD domain-containing putative transcriptional regulator n=1 Tax=Streptomyces sp. NRRL B-1347 TaxID=1476877 RepID=UPI0004C94992|nr:BTAD domain-containing putative transcriptional regulator [Streptomyces sp. NRRL B-1347]
MRFGVLGPLAVWTAEGVPVAVPGAKSRALLAELLAHGGRPVSADRLIDALWGAAELPGNPAAALQTKVWQVRRALAAAEPGGRDRLTLGASGYVLRVDAESLDADRFDALTARARSTPDPRARAALLTDALALWRGRAFDGFADTDGARPLGTRLEEARLAALEARAEARLELGEHEEVLGEVSQLVEQHPLRERLRAVQMRALYATGRTGDALDSYRRLRAHLAEELGLDPGPELAALQEAVLRRDPALAGPPGTTARTVTNLPASVTELVGRDGAVADVTALFGTARHVTLTGAGGVGKTRLALAAAARLVTDFPDGTWLVELAALNRASVVPAPAGRAAAPDDVSTAAEAVMTVLGIRQEGPLGDERVPGAAAPGASADRLAEALADKRLLLVLDNCEHVVEPVAELVTLLLKRSPGLRVLATSQEALGNAGESVFAVPPLDVPEPTEEVRTEAVARASAARLFVARAAAAAPGFALDDGNAGDVAVICRRLDGIPLALELAATRLRALGVRDLVDRLDDRFRLLTTGYRGAPPRQQTLRAMIDWSWDLLTGPERTVLRRLAVHADGCTLAAAEAVCGGDGVDRDDVLDLLARLVDRSLVVRADGAAGPRYRLLESVADYSVGRLREADETARVRAGHRAYYTALAESAADRLRGGDQRRGLGVLDAETANLRRALDDAVRHGAAPHALRLVNALSWYWFLRGRLREARRSLDAALTAAAEDAGATASAAYAEATTWRAAFAVLLGEDVDTAERRPSAGAIAERGDGAARACWLLGFALFWIGDQSASEELIDRSLAEFRARGDLWGTAAALSVRANQAQVRGDLATLEREGRESAALFTRLGDRWGQLQTVEPLAALAEMAGDHEEAARRYREGLRMAEDLGLCPEAVAALHGLGNTAMLAGDHTAAQEYFRRAGRLSAAHGYKPGEIRSATGLGLSSRRAGQLDAAEAGLRPVLQWLTRMAFEPGRALVLAELGFIAEQRGDAAQALRLHREGRAAARHTGDVRALALALEGLAGAHAAAGEQDRAALLLGAAHAARESVGMPLPPGERGDVDRITAVVRARLDQRSFRTAYGRGLALAPDDLELVAGGAS